MPLNISELPLPAIEDMEGLQELARSTFHKEQQFCGSGSDFDIISISAFPSQPTSYMAVPASEGELEPFLAQAAPWNKGEDAEATLKLVHIPRENDGTLRISQHIFLDIFQSFNTEPHTLYMISRNCYGFHCFKANNTSTENISYTFFIGTVLYMLIWSFNPVSMTTRAMLLPRRSNGLRDGKAAFCEFENIVHLYKDYIYTLCLLVFVSSVHVIHFIDEYIAVELNEIRDIEANTGHGAWIKSRSKDRFDIGEITEWSKRVGGCLVDLSNQFRHEQIATSLISFLHGQGDSDWSQNIQDAYLRKHDAGMEIFKSAIPVLQRQADNGKLYVEYLQERAKSQSSVVRFLESSSLLSLDLTTPSFSAC